MENVQSTEGDEQALRTSALTEQNAFTYQTPSLCHNTHGNATGCLQGQLLYSTRISRQNSNDGNNDIPGHQTANISPTKSISGEYLHNLLSNSPSLLRRNSREMPNALALHQTHRLPSQSSESIEFGHSRGLLSNSPGLSRHSSKDTVNALSGHRGRRSSIDIPNALSLHHTPTHEPGTVGCLQSPLPNSPSLLRRYSEDILNGSKDHQNALSVHQEISPSPSPEPIAISCLQSLLPKSPSLSRRGSKDVPYVKLANRNQDRDAMHIEYDSNDMQNTKQASIAKYTNEIRDTKKQNKYMKLDNGGDNSKNQQVLNLQCTSSKRDTNSKSSETHSKPQTKIQRQEAVESLQSSLDRSDSQGYGNDCDTPTRKKVAVSISSYMFECYVQVSKVDFAHSFKRL